jgi:hypothetical protein
MGRLIVHNAVTVNGAFEAPDPDKWLVLGVVWLRYRPAADQQGTASGS